MARRIVLIVNGTDFGGTESAVCETACALHRRGHDVSVVSLKPIGRTGRRIADVGVPIWSLGMPERLQAAAFLVGCVRLAAWLKRQRPHVVHAFLPQANVMSRIALIAGHVNAVHVSGERSTDLMRRGVVRWLNRGTLRWTDHVLAVSAEVRDRLLTRERMPEAKLSVLENGIDIDALDACPASDVRGMLRIDPWSVVICSAGRLIPEKGNVYLIRALARMREAHRAHLVFVGEGPDAQALRAEADRHGLSNRVHFLGFHADLAAILKAVDLLALPSLEEGIPMVVLEAMACGLAVVATDVGGLRRLVVPDVTGILVPPAQRWAASETAEVTGAVETGIAALAAALDRLVADPAARAAMGANARQRAVDHFSLERMVSTLEDLYEQLAARDASLVVGRHWRRAPGSAADQARSV